jgi:MFS superfamily sulfate permease-like transporter
MADTSARPPRPGLFANLRFDALAGFLVSLIALPLCLAVARASGFPPVAGIWTAVAGGLIATWVSDSPLTIKGPAAGLIVVVAGSVTGLGRDFVPDPTAEQRRAAVATRAAEPKGPPARGRGEGGSRLAGEAGEEFDKELEGRRAVEGYKLTLGIAVVAGVIQVLLGLLRAGRLVDFFPLTPVHGMLAGIGIIIIAKQAYAVAGVDGPKVGKSLPELFGLAPPHPGGGEPPGVIQVLAEFPSRVTHFNPEILVIGVVSLVILFAHYVVKNRWVKRVPAQLVVLVVAVALGSQWVFDLGHEHKHLLPAHLLDGGPDDGEAVRWPQFLVEMPDVLAEPQKAFFLPDFRGVATLSGLRWVFLFVAVGSLESLLAAKAVDLLDPWKRKTDFDRDLIGIGIANAAVAAVGGLPMISEIVRSKANIDNGGRGRVSNFSHGVFLLAAVLAMPGVLREVPLAALGAVLVFAGFRLANPSEFVKAFPIGAEQLVVFVGTVLVTLATDLLVGVTAGIGLELAFHVIRGGPARTLFLFQSDVEAAETDGDERAVLLVNRAATFTNWMGLRKAILTEAGRRREVVVDLSRARLVDHSVMEKLHELEAELAAGGKHLTVTGLDGHKPLSSHPLAARTSTNPAPVLPR